MAVLDPFFLPNATVPCWRPPLAVALLALLWRELRSSGRHSAARVPVRTAVRTGTRGCPDTSLCLVVDIGLTWADTSSGVSADTCPDGSGHHHAGES